MAALRIWQKRLLLVLMGITIGLVGVEVGLRVAGTCFLARQSQRQRSTGEGPEVIILCLGESTTAETIHGDSYPRQLQEILAERKPSIAFKVVNLGVPGTTTGRIVSQLDAALAEHHPDIVITMMGANDGMDSHESSCVTLGFSLRELRVFKLIESIFTRSSRFCILPSDSTSKREDPCDVLGSEFFLTPKGYVTHERVHTDEVTVYERAKLALSAGHTNAAIQGFEAAILARPCEVKPYVRLASLYWGNGQSSNAMSVLEKGIAQMPEEAILASVLARYRQIASDRKSGRLNVATPIPIESEDFAFKQAADIATRSSVDEVFSRALRELEVHKSGDPWPVVALITSASEARGNGIPMEKANRIALLAQDRLDHDGSQRVVGALASVCCSHGDQVLAETFWSVCKELQRRHVSLGTRANYRKLQSVVLASGAVLVAMQYPMLDSVGLEQMVEPSDRTLILVNASNFRRAVGADGLGTYFTDMFGGSFGHCTRKGNRLLAQNAAESVLRIVSRESALGRPSRR